MGRSAHDCSVDRGYGTWMDVSVDEVMTTVARYRDVHPGVGGLNDMVLVDFHGIRQS